MCRVLVDKAICMLMKAKSRFTKLKGWLTPTFTLNSI